MECPIEYTQQWHGVIKSIVESRVNKVKLYACITPACVYITSYLLLLQLNPENRIHLLCVLESCEGTPDLLTNIFTEAAIAAVDMINEQVRAYVMLYTCMYVFIVLFKGLVEHCKQH